MTRRLLPLLLQLPLVVLIFLSACGRNPSEELLLTPDTSGPILQPSQQRNFEKVDCPFRVQEGMQVRCGYVSVPEDYRMPDGAKLKLAVAVYTSPSVNPKPDPVLLLTSNPSPGLSTGGMIARLYQNVYAERDLIAFDQRGVGRSQPALDCPDVAALYNQSPDLNVFDQDMIDQVTKTLEACKQKWTAAGAQPALYTSEAVVQDIQALRMALGYDQWNIIASGYGTQLAQMAMQVDPRGIRSVVLDAIQPVQLDGISDQAVNTQQVLDRFFQRCADDEQCQAAFPDLRKAFYQAVDDLNARPIQMPVADLNQGMRYSAYLDGYRFMDVVIAIVSSASQQTLPELPRTIYQVRDGKYEQLAKFMATTRPRMQPYLSGMRARLTCVEMMPRATEAQVRQAASKAEPQIAGYYEQQYQALRQTCRIWEDLVRQAGQPRPVQSDIPALILYGDQNIASSTAWSKQVAGTLARASYVEFYAVSSGIRSPSSCGQGIITAFLANPLGAVDGACAAEKTKQLWVTLP